MRALFISFEYEPVSTIISEQIEYLIFSATISIVVLLSFNGRNYFWKFIRVKPPAAWMCSVVIQESTENRRNGHLQNLVICNHVKTSFYLTRQKSDFITMWEKLKILFDSPQ